MKVIPHRDSVEFSSGVLLGALVGAALALVTDRVRTGSAARRRVRRRTLPHARIRFPFGGR